ncbi:hypothetical protein H632_c727p1 [Helicosporidium sp. ATCC 50920]|nr:hypothetical protein H632_c727p1 [Helicosporidium sp. ATCC 50920]|eukprot:KDD75353.1 hypothetical protein H632_c727p1 [Helicosporidium sp. ATCC 50920]
MRGLLKARKLGVDTPVMYSADVKTGMMIQECVDGVSVREALQQDSLPNRDAILKAIGQCLAKMHDGGLIHGDLTTSNMLLRHKDQSLVMIDFGLSYNSILPEDKGVDLYVLERAFASAHAGDAEAMFDVVLTAYRQSSRMWSATLNRFAEVRTRGRKRSMVG